MRGVLLGIHYGGLEGFEEGFVMIHYFVDGHVGLQPVCNVFGVLRLGEDNPCVAFQP